MASYSKKSLLSSLLSSPSSSSLILFFLILFILLPSLQSDHHPITTTTTTTTSSSSNHHHHHHNNNNNNNNNNNYNNNNIIITTTTTTDHPLRIRSINYSNLYDLQSNPISRAFILLSLIIWLGFLFSFLGIVASDFLSPNLSTISINLGLSESLTGVTLLGFGNGAPDVFSTYAAMKAGTASLAIGELIGAGSLIVSLVVGSMSIIRPFKVPRHSFLRDLGFLIIAVLFVIIIISDGFIHPWEAITLVLLYLIYVLTVLYTTWSVQKKLVKLDQLRIARNHYTLGDQLCEAYLDDPDLPIQPSLEPSDPPNDITTSPARSSPDQLQPPLPRRPKLSSDPLGSISTSSSQSHDSFKSLLDTDHHPLPLPVPSRRMRAPSLSYRPVGSDPPTHNLLNSTNPSSHPPAPSSGSFDRPKLPRTRSISSQEALNSPPSPDLIRRTRRSTMVINPIRPSLLGAIEFRDVVNSLSKDAIGPLTRLHPRASQSTSSSGRRPRSDSLGVGMLPGTAHVTRHPSSSGSAANLHRSSDLNHPSRRITEFAFPLDHHPKKNFEPPSPSSVQSAIDRLTFQQQQQHHHHHHHHHHQQPRESEAVDHHPPIHTTPPSVTPRSIIMARQSTSSSSGKTIHSNLGSIRNAGTQPSYSEQPPPSSPISLRINEGYPSPRGIRLETHPLPSIMITSDRQEVIHLPHSPNDDEDDDESGGTPTDQRRKRCRFSMTTGARGRDYYRRWKGLMGVIQETLLPTLKDWRMKSLLGKFVAVFSIPAVLLLTLTLPVVTDDGANSGEDEEMDVLMSDRSESDDEIDPHPNSTIGLGLLEEVPEGDQVGGDDDGRDSNLIGTDQGPTDHPTPPPLAPKLLTFNLDQAHRRKNESNRTEDRGLGIQMGVVGPIQAHHHPGRSIDRESQTESYHESPIDFREEEGMRTLGGYEEDETYHPRPTDHRSNPDDQLEATETNEGPKYSDQQIARLLTTVQTTLSPPFWLVCFGRPDEAVDHHPGDRPPDSIGSLPEIGLIPKPAIRIILSVLVGLILARIVYKSLAPPPPIVKSGGPDDHPRGIDDRVDEERSLLSRTLKSVPPRRSRRMDRMIKNLLCLLGFVNSIVWILKIVDEVTEIIRFIGLKFHISNAILGLTLFGIGNSLGDFVANVTVAKMGFPVMAISACFGGPLLNILLGIGLSSNIVMRSSRGATEEDRAIRIEASKPLFISSFGLLFGLLLIYVLVPTLKHFVFDRQVGVLLILGYSLIFLLNVLVESFA